MAPEDCKNKKDEEILELSIKSPSVFGVLVDRYQEAFLRNAYKIVRNSEEAEDIVQNAFTRIYINAGKFKKVEGASFSSWAYKILINTALTHYKKLKKMRESVEYVDFGLYDKFIGDEKDMELDTDAKLLVSKVLSNMPKNLREILEKYYLEDKSQKDIALEENVSVATIKMRVFRAKKAFRKIIEENLPPVRAGGAQAGKNLVY